MFIAATVKNTRMLINADHIAYVEDLGDGKSKVTVALSVTPNSQPVQMVVEMRFDALQELLFADA